MGLDYTGRLPRPPVLSRRGVQIQGSRSRRFLVAQAVMEISSKILLRNHLKILVRVDRVAAVVLSLTLF